MEPLALAIRRASRMALSAGALVPIATATRELPSAGVVFLVRALERLEHKQRAAAQQVVAQSNPFLPPEPALVVAELSATHRALLNKFPVLDDHLLLVTRAFEPQDGPLRAADFEAAWLCLREIDGLIFYNAGEAAGASQPHKHLQLVPLPLAPGLPELPAQPLFEQACRRTHPGRSQQLPFAHAGCRADDLAALPPERAGAATVARCRELFASLSLAESAPGPYNLLLTRRLLLLVPRRRAEQAGIPVNALGYAGALLVRDAAGFEELRRIGPLELLRDVGLPAPPVL